MWGFREPEALVPLSQGRGGGLGNNCLDSFWVHHTTTMTETLCS